MNDMLSGRIENHDISEIQLVVFYNDREIREALTTRHKARVHGVEAALIVVVRPNWMV